MLHSCIKGFLRAKKLWVNPPKAERAKPSLSSDYNLLFKNKIGERSLDIHRVHTIPKVMNLLTALGLAAKPPEETPVKVPGKRGRPKGSRNKSTLERIATGSEEPVKPKRGPGRPKGSKNKKTLEREARERAQAAADSQAP